MLASSTEELLSCSDSARICVDSGFLPVSLEYTLLQERDGGRGRERVRVSCPFPWNTHSFESTSKLLVTHAVTNTPTHTHTHLLTHNASSRVSRQHTLERVQAKRSSQACPCPLQCITKSTNRARNSVPFSSEHFYSSFSTLPKLEKNQIPGNKNQIVLKQYCKFMNQIA